MSPVYRIHHFGWWSGMRSWDGLLMVFWYWNYPTHGLRVDPGDHKSERYSGIPAPASSTGSLNIDRLTQVDCPIRSRPIDRPDRTDRPSCSIYIYMYRYVDISEYLRVCRRPFVAWLNGCTIAKWKGHSHFCIEMMTTFLHYHVYVCGFSVVA